MSQKILNFCKLKSLNNQGFSLKEKVNIVLTIIAMKKENRHVLFVSMEIPGRVLG